jgi:hypothetical protein
MDIELREHAELAGLETSDAQVIVVLRAVRIAKRCSGAGWTTSISWVCTDLGMGVLLEVSWFGDLLMRSQPWILNRL